MTVPELYVLRHGETEWNREGRLQGHHDSPLTEEGRAQAARQHRILAGRDLSGFTFHLSPLGRCLQTAGIALGGIAGLARTDDRLMEIGVGEWETRLRADLAAEGLIPGAADDPALYQTAPGGEGFSGLEVRCRSFLSDLDGPAVIVTHGITSRMLRSLALARDPLELLGLPGGQGNVFHIADGRSEELR